MAIRLTKKFKTILFVVLGILVVGGGGYLLWRINQEDTVAPTDSDAALDCSKYTYQGQTGCIEVYYPSTTKCCGTTICSNGNGYCALDVNTNKEICIAYGQRSATSCSFSVNNVYQSSIPLGCYKSVNYSWMTCTASTPPATTYTLTYTAGSNGTITGTSPQTVNKGASGTSVTAVPNSGYKFSKWSDNLPNSTRTDSNVQGNISVTATFEAEATPVTTYTLTYTAGANGTITGNLSQTVSSGGSGTSVTAVANSGYRFSKWSDNSTASTRTDTNVQANKSLTATFVEIDAPIEPTYTCINFNAHCSADNQSIVVGWTALDESILLSYTIRVNEFPFLDWMSPTDQSLTKGVLGSGLSTYTYSIPNIKEGVEYNVHVSAYQKEKDANDAYVLYPGCIVPANATGPSTVLLSCGGDNPIVPTGGDTIPQTGIFDSVIGRISVGATFILLGGLISQYSKLSYLYNSISDRNQFRREVRRSTRKSNRMNKSRNKLESRFR